MPRPTTSTMVIAVSLLLLLLLHLLLLHITYEKMKMITATIAIVIVETLFLLRWEVVMIFSADEIPYSDEDVVTTVMYVEIMITVATTEIPIMMANLDAVVVIGLTMTSYLWTTSLIIIPMIVMRTTAPFDVTIHAEIQHTGLNQIIYT